MKYEKAYERFRRLDPVRVMPKLCDGCHASMIAPDRISVIERRGRNPLVMHEVCGRRYRAARGEEVHNVQS